MLEKSVENRRNFLTLQFPKNDLA